MSDREAFEKWYTEAMGEPNVRRYADSRGVYTQITMQSAWQAWQAKAQAQAGQPIAAVHGWFHGECVIRPLDPESVLPVGMALYSQPQAQAGEGSPYGYVSEHTNGMAYFHTNIVEIYRDTALSITPVYAAPPAAKVNQQLLELETYDAGYLNDFGGGNVSWWHDYIRSELGRAHDFYSSQIAAAQEQSK